MNDSENERLLTRLRRAPQHPERLAALEAILAQYRVGPAVRERILRLNPSLIEGRRLRGWHPKRHFDPGINVDAVSKGKVIARHGRAFWASLPRSAILKRGRREFVTSLALMQARP